MGYWIVGMGRSEVVEGDWFVWLGGGKVVERYWNVGMGGSEVMEGDWIIWMGRGEVVMGYWGVVWREGVVGGWEDLLGRVRDRSGVDEVRSWGGVGQGGLLDRNAFCWKMNRYSCDWKSCVWWWGGRSVISYGLYVRSIGWVGERSWFGVEVGKGVEGVERIGWGVITWWVVRLVGIVGRCLVGWREGRRSKSLYIVVWINGMLRMWNFWHMVQFRIKRTYWSMNRKV